MSFPKFFISVPDFNVGEESKLFSYLRDVSEPNLSTLRFDFHFSCESEYKVHALRNEALEHGFKFSYLRTDGHKGKVHRWYLVLHKEISITAGQLLAEVEYLKDAAQFYGLDFYQFEPCEG